MRQNNSMASLMSCCWVYTWGRFTTVTLCGKESGSFMLLWIRKIMHHLKPEYLRPRCPWCLTIWIELPKADVCVCVGFVHLCVCGLYCFYCSTLGIDSINYSHAHWSLFWDSSSLTDVWNWTGKSIQSFFFYYESVNSTNHRQDAPVGGDAFWVCKPVRLNGCCHELEHRNSFENITFPMEFMTK